MPIKKSTLTKSTERETDIQKAVCDYLAMKKHLFWRQNNIPVFDPYKEKFRALPKYSMKGVADIIVIDNTGHAIFLEIKRKSGYQTPEQKEFERLVKEKGAEYYVIRNLDQVREVGL